MSVPALWIKNKTNKKLCLEKEGFNFCSIEYKGKGIHALMKEVEEERSVCSECLASLSS